MSIKLFPGCNFMSCVVSRPSYATVNKYQWQKHDVFDERYIDKTRRSQPCTNDLFHASKASEWQQCTHHGQSETKQLDRCQLSRSNLHSFWIKTGSISRASFIMSNAKLLSQFCSLHLHRHHFLKKFAWRPHVHFKSRDEMLY